MKALPITHEIVSYPLKQLFITKMSDPTGSDYEIVSTEHYKIMVVGTGWMKGYQSFDEMRKHLGHGYAGIKLIGIKK